MGSYFFDSSALVRNYVEETGNRWVAELLNLADDHAIHAASITEVEVVAALARRSKSLPALHDAIKKFKSDFDSNIQIIDITPELIDSAVQLAEKHALRGYDAIQLAAAIRINGELQDISIAMSIVSADDELNAAATAEGLRVENPNLHG